MPILWGHEYSYTIILQLFFFNKIVFYRHLLKENEKIHIFILSLQCSISCMASYYHLVSFTFSLKDFLISCKKGVLIIINSFIFLFKWDNFISLSFFESKYSCWIVLCYVYYTVIGLPRWLVINSHQPVKRWWGIRVWSLLGWFAEEEHNPLQYSARKNPMDRRNWQVTAHRVAKSRTQLSDLKAPMVGHCIH